MINDTRLGTAGHATCKKEPMLRRLARVMTILVVTLAVSTTATAPASAGTSYLSRTTGNNANAQWTQVDGTLVGSPFGNVHIGWLDAYETSNRVGDAFAYIDDYDCEPGQLPDSGDHGELAPGCTYVGSRYGHGFNMTFVVDKKLGSASLQGSLTMVQGGGHDGPGDVVGQPSVNMTWSGYGNTVRSTSTYRYDDGTTTYSERYKSSSRSAIVGGNIGPMTFDPALSGGALSSFASTSRSRS